MKKTVSIIRETIKKSGNHNGLHSVNSENRLHPAWSIKYPEVEIPDITHKQKKILMTTLGDFQTAKLQELKTNRSEPVFRSTINENMTSEKLKLVKERQQENFKEIKNNELKRQRDLFNQFTKSMKEHTEREELIDKYKKIRLQEKDNLIKIRINQIQLKQTKESEAMEVYIQEKLSRIDNKIQKSNELHNEEMKKKIDKTIKLREIAERVAKNQTESKKTNEVELVNKMMMKQMHVHETRLRIEDRIHKATTEKREQFEKHREIAIEKIKQTEKEMFVKSLTLERRIKKSQKLVSEKKEKMMRDLALKQEMLRLQQQEKLVSIQRAKRVYVSDK